MLHLELLVRRPLAVVRVLEVPLLGATASGAGAGATTGVVEPAVGALAIPLRDDMPMLFCN